MLGLSHCTQRLATGDQNVSNANNWGSSSQSEMTALVTCSNSCCCRRSCSPFTYTTAFSSDVNWVFQRWKLNLKLTTEAADQKPAIWVIHIHNRWRKWQRRVSLFGFIVKSAFPWLSKQFQLMKEKSKTWPNLKQWDFAVNDKSMALISSHSFIHYQQQTKRMEVITIIRRSFWSWETILAETLSWKSIAFTNHGWVVNALSTG